MIATPTPEWLSRRWADILAALLELDDWVVDYTRGHAEPIELPTEAPTEIALLKESDDWAEFPHKDLYASRRQVGDTGCEEGEEYLEISFGDLRVFRVSRADWDKMNEHDRDDPPDNSRVIDDEDHVIEVYAS